MAIRPLLPLVADYLDQDDNQGWGSGSAFQAKLPTLPTADRAELTALQMLEKMELEKRRKKGKSLFGHIKGSVGGALSFIARPSHGIAEGFRRALHGESNDFDFGGFFSGLGAGLSGKAKTGFGQVLDEHGVLDSHKFLRGVAGLGLDIATDPLMLASVAAAPVTGGASLAALSARLAEKGLSVKAVTRASSIAAKGSDNLDELNDARNILHRAGDGFKGRAELAEEQFKHAVIKAQRDPTPGELSRLHGLQAYAASEARGDLPKVLTFTYKIPFAKKSTEKYLKNGRIQVRTPVRTFGLKSIADRKIPLVSQVADSLGQAVKPGWRNEKFHALERVGRATVEVREKEYLASIGAHLKDFIDPKSPKFLPDEAQLDALDFGETAVGIVRTIVDSKGNQVSRVLDNEMIDGAVRAGTLSATQGDFLKSWHKATEVLSDADRDYKRFYSTVLPKAKKIRENEFADVMYVPHAYTRDGRKLTQSLGTSILTKPGFEYERLSKAPNSVKMLRALHEVGEYRNLVESSPSKLLAMRARRGAQSHADRMIEDVIATAEGIPTKIANVVKQKKFLDEIGAREAKLAELPLATPEGLAAAVRTAKQNVDQRVDQELEGALGAWNRRTEALQGDLKKLKDATYRARQFPSANKILNLSSEDFNKVFKKGPLKGIAMRARRQYAAAQAARRFKRSIKPTVARAETSFTVNHKLTATARTFLTEHGKLGKDLKAKLDSPSFSIEDARYLADELERIADSVRPGHAKGRALKSNARRLRNMADQLSKLRKKPAARAHGSKYKSALYDLFEKTKPPTNSIHYKDWKTARKSLLEQPMRKGENWSERLDTGIKFHEAAARKMWNDALKTRRYKAPPRNLAATRGTKKKALARHMKAREGLVRKYEAKRNALMQRELIKIDKQRASQARRAETHRKLIAKAERKVEFHESSLDNPLAKKPGYVPNDKIRAENGKPMAIPQEIDEAITKIRQVIHDDEFIRDFHRTWNQLMGRWKVGVTVVNPGYRIRNTLSDMWNMFISPEGGVPLWAIGRYGNEAADIIYKKIPAGDPEALRLFQEAYEHSIMSGLFGGDIEKVLRTMRSGLKDERGFDYAKRGRLIKAWSTGATKFNRNSENWGRLTHYLYRRKYEGRSAADAASIVRTAHFDYEDLTQVERKIKNALIPFYTWSRNNIPYQIQQMAASPGRYATFPKLVNEMEYASGEGGVTPPWIEESFGFRVPFGENAHFLPQFGPADLKVIRNPKSAAGLLGPAIKAPMEALLFNKSLLTGAPIHGPELAHPRNPVSDEAAGILGALGIGNVGQTARQVKGEMVRGPGADPLISYLAGQTPLTNLLVNQRSNIRQAQRGEGASMLSYLSGLATYSPDPEQAVGIAEQEWNKAFRQYVRGLRDEGRWPEPEERSGKFDEERRRLLELLLR